MKVFVLACSVLLLSSNLFGQREDFAHVDFRKADSIARLYPRYSLYDIRGLAQKLSAPLPSDIEKFRAIYTWTCLNIENDYALYITNKEKREKTTDREELKKWNKEFNPIVMQTLLKKYKTVCTGYAYIIRELSLHAGLSCEMINGYGRTAQANIGGPGIANHSWYAIQLNNKWYLCDATWSSGSVNAQQKNFVKEYNDCYFLLEPALFVRNHYPSDTTWMLVDAKPTLQEFLNRPLVYNSIFKYPITQLFPETFEVTATKGKAVSFQFSTPAKIGKVELEVEGMSRLTAKSVSLSGLSSVDHVFKSRGKYTVHILLDGKYACTYSVTVM